MNLKGDLPEGYTSAGAKTVNGVGKVTGQCLAQAADSPETSAALRHMAEEMAAIWGSINAIDEPARREELLQRYGADLIKASNKYAVMMENLGLKGPYS